VAGADPTERTLVIEGANSIEELGTRARELGRRVFFVTDAGLVAAGHVARAEELLRKVGLELERFDSVHENPTSDDVEACHVAASAFAPDLLIGFGGGSSIDVAKGVNLLLACGGALADFEGRRMTEHTLLPLIAVPTTAGTGTEVQSFALIAEPGTHRKMACGDPQLAPRLAILDPALTLSLPRFVTACTGLDAIGHAVESAVTSAGNPTSTRLARESFALAAHAFPRVLEAPNDLDARASMLRAASLAGRAIENSMLGAAHSMANPLTAHFDVPHGQAVAMALPLVVRFNSSHECAGEIYRALCMDAGLARNTVADGGLADLLSSFLDSAGLPRASADCGVSAKDSARLAREAASQWTARYNPRPIGVEDFEALFDQLHRGEVNV